MQSLFIYEKRNTRIARPPHSRFIVVRLGSGYSESFDEKIQDVCLKADIFLLAEGGTVRE